jgi:small subunit ribosomal protein S16
MPVKIRLQRHGKKGKPFYWVVAADVRSKRDGKFLEKLGIYNPNTDPATIEINVDNSVKWLQNGAQPSDTAKRILSYKGVMLKHHLLGGLRKGALTEEQVEEKFNAWLEEKEKAVADKMAGLDKAKADARTKALQAEKEVSEKRALAAAEVEVPEAESVENVTNEVEATEAVPAVEVVEAAVAPDTVEVVEEKTEAKEETPDEEVAIAEEVETPSEETVAEVKEEEVPVAEEAVAEVEEEELPTAEETVAEVEEEAPTTEEKAKEAKEKE